MYGLIGPESESAIFFPIPIPIPIPAKHPIPTDSDSDSDSASLHLVLHKQITFIATTRT